MIQSKPTTDEYREGWERVFGGPFSREDRAGQQLLEEAVREWCENAVDLDAEDMELLREAARQSVMDED